MSEPGLISIVGGESTGKSMLATALGARLPALVVSEYLREWVDQRGRVPDPAEQAEVMAGHRESELAALRAAGRTGLSWVVSDSGPLMTAVYSMQYYDDTSLMPAALDCSAGNRLVVWCQDDFPWQPDPQRDGPHARATSQQILTDIFTGRPDLPLLAVRGTLDERVAAVLDSVAAEQHSPAAG